MNTKIKAISALLSALSLIPAIFIFIYVADVYKLHNHEALPAEKVDEILSRTIMSAKFMIPMIFSSVIVITQGVFSAIILRNEKSYLAKSFAVANLIFGGILISDIFIIIAHFKKETKQQRRTYKVVKSSLAIVSTAIPLAATAMWIKTSSPDEPTNVKEIILNEREGKENVIEIFTDGFDPLKTKPLFDNDPAFSDFIAMNRVITGGYLTEPSYTQMMGGFERNPFELRKEFESNNYKIPKSPYRTEYSAYLHDNFLDTVLNRLGRDGIDRGYIANPDDLGYFPSYFQHVSGDPQKVINRNNVLKEIKNNLDLAKITGASGLSVVNNLEVLNWGQAKDDTASGVVNNIQNNAAIYKWVSSHIKTINDDSQTGSRIFMQDSLTHSPRTVDENGDLTFSKLEQFGGLFSDKAFRGAHTVIHNFIEDLKLKNPVAFDNSLIVIYGDHSDHANPTPVPGESGDSLGYEKAHSQILIKYPHTKDASQNQKLINDYTPFANPNLKYLISDYFANKNAYNRKTAAEQMQIMSSLIKGHSKNEFMVVDSDAKIMNASFVKWFIDENNHANDVIVPSKYDFLQEDKTISPADNWLTYGEWADQNNPNHDKIMELYNGLGWK